MMYVDFTAGNKDYKLRLNTRQVVALEKQLGCNPIDVLMKFETTGSLPTSTQMVNILYCALVPLNHGISLDDAFNIFDTYLDDGHAATDFFAVILQIYKVSGLLRNDDAKDESEKN